LIHDPGVRGRTLAAFFLEIEPRLFGDLEESGLIPASALPERARREWECFALYACVRGLVAAGGFNRETAAAIDGLHTAVLETWMANPVADENFDQRRARISERYAEYGAIGQQGGAAGAASVTARLGAAAAAHIAEPAAPREGLAEIVGGAHEALVEGATEAVRRGMEA
jgi:hypothetical protein